MIFFFSKGKRDQKRKIIVCYRFFLLNGNTKLYFLHVKKFAEINKFFKIFFQINSLKKFCFEGQIENSTVLLNC
jgi:hypothetical protein